MDLQKMLAIAAAIALANDATAFSAVPVVDMDKIAEIESSMNPRAYNKKTKARGMHQVTPIALKEYNRAWNTQIAEETLFSPSVSATVANWYMNVRIVRMLKYSKIPVTTINMLIAYHDGIGNLLKFREGKRELGAEMKGYLQKYERLV